MCLLAGQGGIIGALLCTSDFLHPRHSTPGTLYHAEHFSFLQFQPWMLIILTRTQLVLLSISNKILGPSQRGADSRSITYERSGTAVTPDCCPVGSQACSPACSWRAHSCGPC